MENKHAGAHKKTVKEMERTDRRRARLTDRLTALCYGTFLLCWVMACCRSDTTFSADSQWLGNLECHTPSPILGQAIQTAPTSRGRKLNFPPLKDRPPNPHQQELREPAVHQVSSATVVRPIRFLLFTHNALARMSTHVNMSGCMQKSWRSHSHKQINTHTIKQMQT